ncbi:MAG: cell wall hydrolase [Candidatus Moranbacteria bacterium]|nr:cell wall hydrolase [Candidatus Moranbacteria bacterium]
MKTMKEYFEKGNSVKDGFEYAFEIEEEGIYLIEIIASAKSWWQNFLKMRLGDDDLAVRIDDFEFPKLNKKRGLFDGEAAWNGNNLKGLSKAGVFIIRLSIGKHRLIFMPDRNPSLKSIRIDKVSNRIDYVPEDNNPAEDGNRRQWITIALADLALKSLNIKAIARNYPGDDDDIKIVIDGNTYGNQDNSCHKNWYWCGKISDDQEKEFKEVLNNPKGLHYIELWADGIPKIKSISLDLGLDEEDGIEQEKKRIPTVDDPEWTGDFSDDTEYMILARAIFGEARSLSEKGRIAIGWSIKNRVTDSRWGNTYHEVVLELNQYSAFNDNDPNFARLKNPAGRKTEIDDWHECYDIAVKVVNGEIEDPTDGANHYFSNYISYPSWTKGRNAELKIKIDNTLFYDLKKIGEAGFSKIAVSILVFGTLIAAVVCMIMIFNGKNEVEKYLTGIMEAEQYKHFFINQKTNEVQVAYFSANGNFLRVASMTDDSYPKYQLNVFQDDELVGYLQDFSVNTDGSNEALMVKNGENDESREIYRSRKPILEWKWLDKKRVDIVFGCGTGCQNYERVNVDTKEVEDRGTISIEAVSS